MLLQNVFRSLPRAMWLAAGAGVSLCLGSLVGPVAAQGPAAPSSQVP